MADENTPKGADVTPKDEPVAQKEGPSKFTEMGTPVQGDLFGNVVGATEAKLPPPAATAEMTAPVKEVAEPPKNIEPATWGASDVKNFVDAGGFRLVAMKGNVEGNPHDFVEIDKLAESWNIRLQSKAEPDKSYSLADLQKMSGDDTLTWNKLLADRGSELFLTLPEPAKLTEVKMTTPVKPEGMDGVKGNDGVATAPVTPVTSTVTAEGENKDKKEAVAPNPADGVETEEQRLKKIKDQEEEVARRAKMNAPQDDLMKKKTSQEAEPERQMSPEEEMALGKYRAAFQKKGYIELMNGEWGVPDVDDELKKALGETGEIRKNKKYGLDFHLPNGHKIEWHANMGGAEFIGMTKRTADFDMDDAHAVVATSASRGWKNINVHGSVEQKDMMWLEAKRQGLEVANHQPSVNSQYRALWNKESQSRLDSNVIGASPMEHGNPSIPRNGMQQEEAADDMTPPAQQKKGPADSPFMKGKGMPTDMTPAQQQTPPAQQMDTVDAFRAFLDREAEAAKTDPAKLAKIQDLKDKLDGKKPAMENVDADIAKTAEAQGVKIPAIVDGSAKPGKVETAADKPTPATALSFEQQLDREIKNEKNSPEVREGLQEMKKAIMEKKLDVDGVKDVKIGMTDGMVSRKDFEEAAKLVETGGKFKASPLKDPPAAPKTKPIVPVNA